MQQFIVLTVILVPLLAVSLPAPSSQWMIAGSNSPNNSPWQASLQNSDSEHICGATLLSERWLITSAQCVDARYPARYNIVLGMYDLAQTEGDPQMYAMDQIIIHPSYMVNQAPITVDYDVALLHVNQDIEMNQYIQPIQVPSAYESPENLTDCRISGWGYTKIGAIGPYSNLLLQAPVDVYTNTGCNVQIAKEEYWSVRVRGQHLCAGKNKLVSACNGDTGGPLACRVNGQWKLHGVTSWFHPSCNPLTPSVFARITHTRIRSFISDTSGL